MTQIIVNIFGLMEEIQKLKLEVKSKIEKIFKNHNPHEEYSVRIYKIRPYFYEHYEKKCKLVIMGVNIYYLELIITLVNVLQQQKLTKKDNTDRDLIFEEKRQKALEKKLGCKFIRINTSNAKNGYDLDYEDGNVQSIIDEFKNEKIKKLEKQLIKEKEIQEKLEKEMREMRNQKVEIKELKDKNKK